MMTRTEREDLLKLARARGRVARAEAAAVTARRKADFEAQLATKYKWDCDAVWKQAYVDADAALAQANETVRRRCRELGIPLQFAPSITGGYWLERGENAIKERRAELTRVAHRRFEHWEKEAKLAIERQAVEVQAQLVAGGLESAEAKAFLEAMPTADQLIPRLTVEEAQRLLPGRLNAQEDEG
jgi:hypothetical protein